MQTQRGIIDRRTRLSEFRSSSRNFQISQNPHAGIKPIIYFCFEWVKIFHGKENLRCFSWARNNRFLYKISNVFQFSVIRVFVLLSLTRICLRYFSCHFICALYTKRILKIILFPCKIRALTSLQQTFIFTQVSLAIILSLKITHSLNWIEDNFISPMKSTRFSPLLLSFSLRLCELHSNSFVRFCRRSFRVGFLSHFS